MGMATNKTVEQARKVLRAKVRAGGDVTVAAADLTLLLDELGRLQQGNDRLRRQNRRVRSRLQRAGLAAEADAGADGEAAETDDDGEAAP